MITRVDEHNAVRPSREEIAVVTRSFVMDIARARDILVQVYPHTKLVEDGQLSSLDFIELLARLEMHFRRRLPFDALMITSCGQYRQELTIQELTTFVYEMFDKQRPLV